MTKKQVLVVMPVLKGGGAERVASILTNEFYKNGYDCEFLLTSCKRDEVINKDLDESIPVLILQEFFEKKFITDIFYSLSRVLSSILCKPFEKVNKAVPSLFSYLSFVSTYYKEIKAMEKILTLRPDATVITFLQPSIPIVLLAGRKTNNRIVISERGDANRLMKHRYGYKFIEKYYERANKAVFQTVDAQNIYPKNISSKGTVIFNPIKENLPERYTGERNKNITTFCRISKEKNLSLLVEALAEIHKICKHYQLRIIGNTANSSDEQALKEITALVTELGIDEYVNFEPFSFNVHENVKEDAVYVNSSDREGMSNAMLEAMAIGMPVVCTDCPVGGAKAIIKNGENGILVPMKDKKSLADALYKIISDKDFSQKLSENAVKIKEELSLSNIAEKWMELI